MNLAGFLPNLLDDHGEIASFLWSVRAHLRHSRTHTLADLTRLDDRLDAHLDALVLAGECAAKSAFVTAFVAVRTGRADVLAAQVRAADGDARAEDDLCAALGWAPQSECAAALDGVPDAARYRARAMRWHGRVDDRAVAAPYGDDVAALERALRTAPAEHAEPRLRAAVAAGEGRAAIEAAAAWGDPCVVPWLASCVAAPPLARLAGWALTTITGVDPVAAKLMGHAPEGFSAGPSDKPFEHLVDADPDARLPWLDPARTAAWCAAAPSAPSGVALLYGRRRDREVFTWALREAPQWARAVARAGLVDAGDAAPLPVDAPAFRQTRALRERSDAGVAAR